jgi:hypothetical protein
MGERLRKRTSAPPPEADEADLFLHALLHGGVDLAESGSSLRDERPAQSNTFTTLLRRKLDGIMARGDPADDVIDMTEHLETGIFTSWTII